MVLRFARALCPKLARVRRDWEARFSPQGIWQPLYLVGANTAMVAQLAPFVQSTGRAARSRTLRTTSR